MSTNHTVPGMPGKLQALLDRSDLKRPIEALCEALVPILESNGMPFFPDYTDHGAKHVGEVLASAASLVPDDVWSAEADGTPIFSPSDAAMLIGGALLHDAAMLLQPKGFLELIGPNGRWKPLPWFDKDRTDHMADRPWHELWAEYEREARRFSDRVLATIIGDAAAMQWKFDGLAADGRWDKEDHLIIGEFIRRHHARLAHEIAMFGFPGLPVGKGEERFPALEQEERGVGDLIGLVARSHGTSLRVCDAYLRERYHGLLRPKGAAMLYPMALLRVADYLQIGHGRAPAVLLQLKDPPSPLSVQEWKVNNVVRIAPFVDTQDRQAVRVEVGTKITHELYLRTRELLRGLQGEMDHATAVLSERYGDVVRSGVDRLVLSKRRVSSDLDDPAFERDLSFVPRRTGFEADPNLLSLLVKPLYGDRPSVGIRELLQNSVDAVRELDVWCDHHGVAKASLPLYEQQADVVVHFDMNAQGKWVVVITDRGIGMKAETIRDYFLRAGASFRNSQEWRADNTDDKGRSIVPRTGRFGIGVFAIFLLGHRFRVRTRHASSSVGYTLEGNANSRSIPILKSDEELPIGTLVEVELYDEVRKWADLHASGIENIENWYTLRYPSVLFMKRNDTTFQVAGHCASPEHPLEREGWRALKTSGFDVVYWRDPSLSTHGSAKLMCNGFLIASEPKRHIYDTFQFDGLWRFKTPELSIWDNEGNLPLTITRYDTIHKELSFENDLVKDMFHSFIAYALLHGPSDHRQARDVRVPHGVPWIYREVSQKAFSTVFRSFPRWCFTNDSFVPFENSLVHLLGVPNCYIAGWAEQERHARSILEPEWALPPGVASTGWFTALTDRFSEFLLADDIHGLIREFRENGMFRTAARRPSVMMDLYLEGLHEDQVWKYRKSAPDPESWSLSLSEGRPERYFGSYAEKTGPDRSKLEGMLDDLKQGLIDRKDVGLKDGRLHRGRSALPQVSFVMELPFAKPSKKDTSPLIGIWTECLGEQGIPFDEQLRQAMIKKAEQHPALAYHLRWWRERHP